MSCSASALLLSPCCKTSSLGPRHRMISSSSWPFTWTEIRNSRADSAGRTHIAFPSQPDIESHRTFSFGFVRSGTASRQPVSLPVVKHESSDTATPSKQHDPGVSEQSSVYAQVPSRYKSYQKIHPSPHTIPLKGRAEMPLGSCPTHRQSH